MEELQSLEASLTTENTLPKLTVIKGIAGIGYLTPLDPSSQYIDLLIGKQSFCFNLQRGNGVAGMYFS